MESKVIGIAGLPGSGKSTIMGAYKLQDYIPYDDINKAWESNVAKILVDIQQNKNLVVSDIMFCDPLWRRKFEQEAGASIEWIFFENNPWQCAKNCLFRFIFQKPNGELQTQIEFIRAYSPNYKPEGGVIPVFPADAPKLKWADKP